MLIILVDHNNKKNYIKVQWYLTTIMIIIYRDLILQIASLKLHRIYFAHMINYSALWSFYKQAVTFDDNLTYNNNYNVWKVKNLVF